MSNLTKRQQALVDLCKNAKTTCDVGCDHGFVGVNLLQTKKTDFLYATDISLLSANKAKVLLEKHNLNSKASVRVGDGLSTLSDDEIIEQVIIAGMGAPLIMQIIDNYQNKKFVKHWVFQPMNELEDFRKYLSRNNFKILRDVVIYDKQKFYHIIAAKNGKQKISENEQKFGKIEKDKDEVYFRWLEEKNRKLQKILANLPKNNEKTEQILQCLEDIKKITTKQRR